LSSRLSIPAGGEAPFIALCAPNARFAGASSARAQDVAERQVVAV
jgi:hypothetical protein